MKIRLAVLAISVLFFGGQSTASAERINNKVKVEIKEVTKGLQHHGLDPGLYVCAGGHLHITGTVQNLTKRTLVSIKLEGRAYDANGRIIGKAYPRKIKPLRLVPLKPGQKAEFDLEFLQIVGEKIRKAKNQKVVVIEAHH